MHQRHYFFTGFISLLLVSAIVALLLWKNDVATRLNSYPLVGSFESINGLLNNAIVRYRGFPVGRVTKIQPTPKSIDVYFFVDKTYPIPQGSTLKIVFDGLVGEKYVEIIPHPTESRNCRPNDRLVGYATSGLSDFIDIGTQNLVELKHILNTMSDVFGDQQVSTALKSMVFSMQSAANNMNHIIDELSKLSNSERVLSIMIEAETLLKNVNQSLDSQDIKKIQTIINDLAEFSAELKQITQGGELKESIFSTLDETRDTFEKSNNVLSTIADIDLKPSVDFGYKMTPDDSYLVYLLHLDFHLRASYLNIGIGNDDKNDKLLNILVNSPLNRDVWLTYGVLKNRPGIGIRYLFNSLPIESSVFFYNFEDPFFDIKLEYLFMKNIFITSGYNEINKPSRSVFLGASVQP